MNLSTTLFILYLICIFIPLIFLQNLLFYFSFDALLTESIRRQAEIGQDESTSLHRNIRRK